MVGGAPTPWLMVGQCATVAVNGPAYPPPPGGDGPYYLGAVIDPQNAQPELIEDNNSSSGYRMGVGNAPDFVVKSVTGPASAQPWQSVTAQVEVCNEGTADGSTDVEVYLSTDDVITPPYGVPQRAGLPVRDGADAMADEGAVRDGGGEWVGVRAAAGDRRPVLPRRGGGPAKRTAGAQSRTTTATRATGWEWGTARTSS